MRSRKYPNSPDSLEIFSVQIILSFVDPNNGEQLERELYKVFKDIQTFEPRIDLREAFHLPTKTILSCSIVGISKAQLLRVGKEVQRQTPGKFEISEPLPLYRESILTKLNKIVLVKSANKRNRLYGYVEPLDDMTTSNIECGVITEKDKNDESTSFVREIVNDKELCWGVDGLTYGANAIVSTTEARWIFDYKDNCLVGLSWAACDGPLAGEPLHGVLFRLRDTYPLNEAIHRGGGQIVPATRRLIHGAVLASNPVLLEPVHKVDFQTSSSVEECEMKALRAAIKDRGWSTVPLTSLNRVQILLPAGETEELEAILQSFLGQNIIEFEETFGHWQRVFGRPENPSTEAGAIVQYLRKLKGLPDEFPIAQDYLDRI